MGRQVRKSGILLPVSSIPSPYGIGAFSKQAYDFVDFLEKAGQVYWQILPLGPTGYGDSPYQSFSTFAGNPYYIDLDTLVSEGLLSRKDCASYLWYDTVAQVDYEKVYLSRFKVLRMAFERSEYKHHSDYHDFEHKNDYWIEDYALYMAVKNYFGGKGWTEWDEDIKKREKSAVAAYKRKLTDEIDFYKFQQYQFAKQWTALKKYANKKGISIIGDIPIYVAMDSADAWANPDLFQLDGKYSPIAVAGCPPDAFAVTGQLWGNPLYDWEYHKKTDYAWWVKRISYCYELYDVVRIDHFRGFDSYYAIPYEDETAENGTWQKGPGYELFRILKKALGKKEIIAEDLGYLTPSVIALLKKTGYPGMKILQFAFDSREESNYLPHNYTTNSVVYTGTHDNDTTLGWYAALNRNDKAFAKAYLGIKSKKEVEWEFIRAALSSVSDTAIIPMQDYLGLDSKGRINTPSTVGENWKWRLIEGQCRTELAEKIRKIAKLYGRI